VCLNWVALNSAGQTAALQDRHCLSLV